MDVIRAYAPAHITGFFEIVLDDDSLHMGSRGCGVVLEHGVTTEVTLSDTTQVEINGSVDEAPTTRHVVDKLAVAPVTVESSFDIPVGCGFGASGAGALSTAHGLNELFSLGLSDNGIAQVAHVAEVECGTGLGDVAAQSYGGLVIRLEAGAPGVGLVDRIPVDDVMVEYVALGPISTKSVLHDPERRKHINRAGRKALKNLLQTPSLYSFIRASREFSVEVDLMTDKVLDMVEAVEVEGGFASMAMLGEAVFAVNGGDALAEFGEVRKSRIHHGGGRLL
jgi:pantoate kinase